jgi:hypothetical protein
MALASYLEVYVSTIVRVAIESDPGALIGLRGKVDGVVLLKSLPSYTQADAAVPAVKGTWQERAHYLRKLFGALPTSLEALLPELERLRTFRNGVGHAFGRGIDNRRPAVELVSSLPLRVSEERLKRWLGVVDQAATAIDRHLLPCVGAYELVRLYHDWPDRSQGYWRDQARKFKKSTGAIAGSNTPSLEYYREAISYYRNVPTG